MLLLKLWINSLPSLVKKLILTNLRSFSSRILQFWIKLCPLFFSNKGSTFGKYLWLPISDENLAGQIFSLF